MVNESSDNYGLSSMTKAKIISLCKKHKLYVTPRLNDVLYLHYQGFTEIKELDEYVGLKCLYLECNAISEISGLENQIELRCLLLHNNVIKKIENLEHCLHLDSINLSHNFITIIENLGSDVLPKLNTLTITNNCLRTEESIANLVHCKTLSVLDLSHNRIDDIVIVKILGQMPELRVLVLTGNPVVNQIPSYRKTLIINCKRLTYLDTRPVFDVDRACAEAWKRGGFEEERKERMRWNQAERLKLISSFKSTLGKSESTEVENNSLSSNEEEQPSSNNEQEMVLQMAEVAANYKEDDTSSSQESSSNEFQDISDDYHDCKAEEVEGDERVKSNNSSSSECSFLSSLEQAVENDCFISEEMISQVTEAAKSGDDIFNVERSIAPCENSKPTVLLIEEINEIQENEDVKLIEESMTDLLDDWNDNTDVLETADENERSNNKSELDVEQVTENFKENEASLRSNSTKIIFYCENINKLMGDPVGEEYDEPIPEITQI